MRLLLLACFALFATDAAAQLRATIGTSTSGNTNARYTLTGATTTTAISGDNGTSSSILQSEVPNSILYRLLFSERNDDPCYVSANFWTAPSGFQSSGSSGSPNFSFEGSYDSWGACAWNRGSSKGLVAQFPPSTQVQGDGGAAAIHGVQVCTNDRNASNLKVKGVKVLVSVMNQDGQGRIVRSMSYAEEFERPNCRKWEEVRRCPQQQVAVGLQVYHRGRNLTGLALKCRAVTVTPL